MIDLSKEIAKELATFTNEVKEGMNEAQEKNAKEARTKLKRTSPKLTGSYAKGWRAKKLKHGWVVHNATDYQLTHLLEKGHAKRGGGRVPAKPHIEKVEQEAIEGYEKDLEKVIRG